MFDEIDIIKLFNAFDIKVLHGWLVDPQDTESYRVIAGLGDYNSVLDLIVRYESSRSKGKRVDYDFNAILFENIIDSNNPINLEHDSLVAKNWIESNTSQLTYYGITTLMEIVEPDEIFVLFRNNHFSTCFKMGSTQLLTLVTDVNFANHPEICWESILDAQGDSTFLNCAFHPALIYKNHHHQQATAIPSDDFQIELTEEEQADRDMALAINMQQEEDLRIHEHAAQMNGSQQLQVGNAKKKKNCSIM